MRKAIIGGTGVYSLTTKPGGEGTATEGLIIDEKNVETRTVNTQYGAVEVDILSIGADRAEIVFLARHGKGHSVPPHLINYRANMMALKLLEVDQVFATCAVGSMREEFGVGQVAILMDFIDFTKTRIQTFYDGGAGIDSGVKHVIMSSPYCPSLSRAFKNQAKASGIDLKGEAVYVCTEGPRFETAAEIAMFRKLGGDVVGMTNVPECVLAKELGMCYSAVGIVTNWCTGIKPEKIELHDIGAALEKNKELITEAFISILLREKPAKDRLLGPESQRCSCASSLISIH